MFSTLPSVHSYPELKSIQSINAHPSNCICIKFDPTGKYFATGSTDALVSLWDVEELVCVRCFSRSVESLNEMKDCAKIPVLIASSPAGWTGLQGLWASAMMARCWLQPPRIISSTSQRWKQVRAVLRLYLCIHLLHVTVLSSIRKHV